MTKGGKLNEDLFKGSTINTPSLLAVEDHLDALKWAEEIGGLKGLIERSQQNLKTVADWVAARDWVDFLADDPKTRSCTSICLKIVDPWFTNLDGEARATAAKRVTSLVEEQGAGLDLSSYRDAPAGIRLWGGATVEPSDMAAVLPWLDWAFETVKSERMAA
jgi:phosphoserine aminotransferase